MNKKQFLLLSTILFTCLNGLATQKQLTAQEIADGIIKKEITINDLVLYDGAMYRLDKFDIATQDNYADIFYILVKPIKAFDIEWGEDVVCVSLKEGLEKTSNYTRHFANIKSGCNYNQKLDALGNVIGFSGTVVGSVAIWIYIGKTLLPQLVALAQVK